MRKIKSLILTTCVLTVALFTLQSNDAYAQADTGWLYMNSPNTCQIYGLNSVQQAETIDAALATTSNASCDVSGMRWRATYSQHRDWCQYWNDRGRQDIPNGESRARAQKVMSCLNAITGGANPSISVAMLTQSPSELGDQYRNINENNRVRRLKKILAAGAALSWDTTINNDRNQLSYALISYSLRVARLFTKLGLSVNSRGNATNTALGLIADDPISARKHKTVRFILRHSGDANSTGEANTSTPIYDAVDVDDLVTVKLLLQYGANPNLEGDTDKTPLIRAIENENSHIVFSLLGNTVAPAAPSDGPHDLTCGSYWNGIDSPLDIAESLGNVFIVDILTFFGAMSGDDCRP